MRPLDCVNQAAALIRSSNIFSDRREEDEEAVVASSSSVQRNHATCERGEAGKLNLRRFYRWCVKQKGVWDSSSVSLLLSLPLPRRLWLCGTSFIKAGQGSVWKPCGLRRHAVCQTQSHCQSGGRQKTCSVMSSLMCKGHINRLLIL